MHGTFGVAYANDLCKENETRALNKSFIRQNKEIDYQSAYI